MNQFPPNPWVHHWGRLEFFRKFTEIFAAQGWPPVSTTPVANLPPVSTTLAAKLPPVSTTPAANLPPVSTTPVANLPPVSTIPAANLPPVSTTPVANCHQYQRHRRQICHRYQRHRWQTMGLISGCRYLKVNLKAKMYICVNSTIQRCPNKIIKKFSDWRFFSFATGVTDTGGQPWAANISANFWKISKRSSWDTLELGGALIDEKNLVTLSL